MNGERKKNYIGKLGYTIFKDSIDSKTLKKIYRDLFVQPMVHGVPPHMRPPKFKVYNESSRKIYIPKYYGISEFGTPEKVDIPEPIPINLTFKGSLRPKQDPIVDSFLKHKNKPSGYGGIISVPCGWGKTVMSIYIISQLKVKTLIIVHKEFLMGQFEEEIKTFLPNAKIGKIQGKTIDVEGKDIVLGMLQSISMKDYPMEIFNGFGLTIYDECHHIGAEVFSKGPRKIHTKYSLGLSATPNRKDGLQKVFEWLIGPICFQVKERDDKGVDVHMVTYESNDKEYNDTPINSFGKTNRAKLITTIADFGPRKQALCKMLKECYEEGRQTLILSDRRSLLEYIHAWCEARKMEVGFYVGGMKQEDLDESAKKKVIVSTFAMSSEGMNIKSLNTLILATPKSDIVQSVGRILRLKPEERVIKPLVIDMIDTHDALDSSFTQRLRFYRKNGYSISNFTYSKGSKTFTGMDKKGRRKKKKKVEYHEMNECVMLDE